MATLMTGAMGFHALGGLFVAPGPAHGPAVSRLAAATVTAAFTRLLALASIAATSSARPLLLPVLVSLLPTTLVALLVALRGIAGRNLFLPGALPALFDLLLAKLFMCAGGALRLATTLVAL
jgi:hypothetical protein